MAAVSTRRGRSALAACQPAKLRCRLEACHAAWHGRRRGRRGRCGRGRRAFGGADAGGVLGHAAYQPARGAAGAAAHALPALPGEAQASAALLRPTRARARAPRLAAIARLPANAPAREGGSAVLLAQRCEHVLGAGISATRVSSRCCPMPAPQRSAPRLPRARIRHIRRRACTHAHAHEWPREPTRARCPGRRWSRRARCTSSSTNKSSTVRPPRTPRARGGRWE